MSRRILLLGILLIFAQGVFAQDRLAKWHKFDFTKKVISKSALKDYALYEAQQLRGIIFGKRGRIFIERNIQDYLEEQAWYKPNGKFSYSSLTANEKKNIDLVRGVEADLHDYVEEGDLRFWRNKLIPEDKIGDRSAISWQIMIAEIEAIHGKTFPDQEWLDKYFRQRYWYKPNPNYNPSILSEIERKNLTALREASNKDQKQAISFGDMDKFQNTRLKEEQLKGLSIRDLRLIRNEFFARRGKKYAAAAYQSLFSWQDWYTPAKDQSKVKLNAIEEENVKLIMAAEMKIHDRLSSELLKEEEIGYLYTEDLNTLKNEIYAKRGRIFKTPSLKKYFESQTWYKPDPNYKDEMLTDIEKNNAALLKRLEGEATSKFSAVEA